MDWCRPFTPDRWLTDGDTVTLGAADLGRAALSRPTRPAHIVVLPCRRAAGAGLATCCSRARSAAPISRAVITRPLIRSITTKLWPLGDDVTFVPGHGPLSTFGDERRSNPYVGDSVLGLVLG